MREATPVQIKQLMTRDVVTVGASNSLSAAARAMWENDIGALPVVDGAHRVVGMLTDRDVAMAAWLESKTLAEIPVARIMTTDVVSCRPDDDIAVAVAAMAEHQVRRLAILDGDDRLVGVLSINDLAVSVADDTDSPAFDKPRIDPGTVAGVLRAVSVPRAR